MISFGILSVRNYPFLNFFVKKLIYLDIYPSLIIFDKKQLSKTDMLRFSIRTGKEVKDFDYFDQNSNTIPTFEVKNHNDKLSREIINDIKLDFLINLGTPRILNQELIKSTKLGILNCHPGILPFFRGCCCVEWSIYYDKPVGNTLHWMDEGIDTGPIIEKKLTKCFKKDSYQDIRKRVYFDGIDLLTDFILRFKNSNNIRFMKEESLSEGKYFKPMEDSLLYDIKNKIKFSKYKYQI